jgi:hypothetical protein
MIEKQHTIEWLDFIITIVLDSSKSEVNTLTTTQYENIIGTCIEKKIKYISFLNQQRLGLFGKRKLRQLIKAHHSSLMILLDQAQQAASQINPLNKLTISAMAEITNCVRELLSLIENGFSQYILLDEPAPKAYVALWKKDLKIRTDAISSDLARRNQNQELIYVLLGPLSETAGAEVMQELSFREIFYQKELLRGIEQTISAQLPSSIHDRLVELLIYMNFNSRDFMNYYTSTLAERINALEPENKKITQLLFTFKEFNQMHRKPGARLISYESDVKKVITNWFTQEISYLKKKSRWDVQPLVIDAPSPQPTKTDPYKVMVLLSVDQIALFLRALDSLRILQARSMNAVFRSITPFLSTPRKTDISWDSMRSKSYAFEEKDKQTVIKVLESVINWIKEY